MLDSGEYETLVTSLSRHEFSAVQLKELYHMRRGIETSFRETKYVMGLIHLHSKKDDLILQEIYATLTMYNYCSRMSASAPVRKRQQCKYAYKINFVMAVHICKRFYRFIINDFKELIDDISKYSEPIRPGRRDKRKLRQKYFAGFLYRAVA
ncbi:MAG: transposase [Clostridia bacterium]|nr:transposase [Clostridia bacterium]